MLTATARAPVPLPAEDIDIGEWLFSLGDDAYAAAAPAHLGAGTSRRASGPRRFFDAENFGGLVIVNHHDEEEARPDYVRVRSRRSRAWLLGLLPFALHVCWEMLVHPRGAAECEVECRLSLSMPRVLAPLVQRHVAEQTRGFAADVAARGWTERTVRLSCGPVRVRERGSGEPILFIHGVLMNGDTWEDVVPRLAGRYRCIAPDWPTGGHRVPLDPGARPSTAMLAALVPELLDELGIERVTAVGIGLGTVICEMLAIEHPERLDRVVFGSGDILSTFPPRWARRKFSVTTLPALANAIVRLFAIPSVRRFAYRPFAHDVSEHIADSFTRGLRSDAGVRRDAIKLLNTIFRRENGGFEHERLRGFDRPALIAWGADDTAFPSSHPDDLAALLDDVRIERIPGAMTFLGQDQPRAFADAIARFMQETA